MWFLKFVLKLTHIKHALNVYKWVFPEIQQSSKFKDFVHLTFNGDIL